MATAKLSDITDYTPAESATVQDKVAAAAYRNGVPPDLLLRAALQESGGNQSAVSPKGATGVMPLMPATAGGLGVDASNVDQNIEGGARLYKQLLDKYNGNTQLAAAAFNAGPGAVAKYGGVPPYKETQNYVQRVAGGQGPALVAQNTAPPPAPISVPLRPKATPASQPIAYDSFYGDPQVGAQTFAGIATLHKAGLATISEPFDWVPAGGGQKITAYSVQSPHAAHIGLWTTDGRKLDPSANWVKAGVGNSGAGGGAPKNLQVIWGTDTRAGSPTQGQKMAYAWDPGEGTMTPMPDVAPADNAGVNLQYLYNKTTGQSGYYAKEHLTADRNTGIVSNLAGHVLEPAFTLQEIAKEREKSEQQHGEDYKALNAQYLNWQGAVQKGELASMRSSFGVPIPAGYAEDKKKSMDWLAGYYNDQKAEIEKRYHAREAYIQSDLEHRKPAQSAQPQQPAQAGQPTAASSGAKGTPSAGRRVGNLSSLPE